MIIDKIKEHFRLYEVIKNDLQPYIEILKKYDKGLDNSRYGIDILLEDNNIIVQWYNGYEDESICIEQNELGNCPEDFDKSMRAKEAERIEQERLKREQNEKQAEKYQREQYEILKKKFENA